MSTTTDTQTRAAASSPTPAEGLCLLCGHNEAVNGYCTALVPICSDDYHGTRFCGCKCEFKATCLKCGHSARRWHGFCQFRAGDDVINDHVCGCECNFAAVPADNDAESLLQHVAYSGVQFDDNRMGYVVVQIDRDVWEQIKKLAPTTTKGDR